MKCRYLKFESPRREDALVISGVGVRESMPPCIVDRPQGTGDRLLMFFYEPVMLKEDGLTGRRESGALMLWGEGAGHYYGSEAGRWCHSWMHFHGAGCPEFLDRCGLVSNRSFHWSDPELLEGYLFRIYRELTVACSPSAELLQLHWQALMLELGRKRNLSDSRQPPPGLSRVRALLDRHPEGRDSLMRLARLAGMSPSHFSAAFRHWFGRAPAQYRLERRMELAAYWLRDHNLSIGEVGCRAGYPDAFQFSRMFRRHTGLSPRAWRESRE